MSKSQKYYFTKQGGSSCPNITKKDNSFWVNFGPKGAKEEKSDFKKNCSEDCDLGELNDTNYTSENNNFKLRSELELISSTGKTKDQLTGGEQIVAILLSSTDKKIIWCNAHEFLDSDNDKWQKLGDSLSGEVVAIREVKLVEQITTLYMKAQPPLQQKIIFGPPGTGKSYSVREIMERLSVNDTDEDKGVFRTTFHPEYSYGDFVAKLLPVTVPDKKDKDEKRVEYQIHAGPFIQALAKALANPNNHFLLVIDEINRGNCAAIFGDIFQLLDRHESGEKSGESEYHIDPSELTRLALGKELKEKLKSDIAIPETLRIPANLSIVATMNTSDESVFYMDSAFKRRWQFEYIGPDDKVSAKTSPEDQKKIKAQEEAKIFYGSGVEIPSDWDTFRNAINKFMVKNSDSVRRIEDKQLGLWFIKAKNGKIAREDIQFKLMHYLWDNVFARDKEPLRELLDLQKDEDKTKLVTFGHFADEYDNFLKAIIDKYPAPDPKDAATS